MVSGSFLCATTPGLILGSAVAPSSTTPAFVAACNSGLTATARSRPYTSRGVDRLVVMSEPGPRIPSELTTQGRRRRKQILCAPSMFLLATAMLMGPPSSQSIPGLPKANAAGLKCPGLSGNQLKECLREYRKAEQGKEAEEEVEEYRQKVEQPGELVTLPSGIQYREISKGGGRACERGSVCAISYQVFRLSSGAYFKYSSGGRPILLFAKGYGTEGQDDIGSVYKFVLGDKNALPRAASVAIEGMKEGGKRRILIPPSVGWVNESVGPQPETFGARRRLENHRDEPLLFEVDMVVVKQYKSEGGSLDEGVQLSSPYSLPAPPNPFKRRIG